jgi:hypothetical protein
VGRPSASSIAEGNFLAAALGAADLAARGHRRRHIKKEGRVAARRRAGRERIGAEQRGARTPGRHGRGRVAEHERDQSRVERLAHVGGGHAEMGAAARRHHADADFARDRNRLLHRPRADHEAETVLPIQRGRGRRDTLGLEHGTRIDQAAPKAVEVARQAAKPVRVDAAQVGADEASGDGCRVRLGHAMGEKQAPGEGVRRAGLDIDARGFDGSRRRHQNLISLTCFARAAQALSRKARSVPVET